MDEMAKEIQNIQEFKSRMVCRKNIMIENIKTQNLLNLMQKVEEGKVYNIITQKSINPYAFLLSEINRHGCIEHLYIATYRVSLKTANNFSYLVKEGVIKDFTLIVNDNYETLMRSNADVLVILDREEDSFRLVKRRSHAKVTLINNADDYIVISGSGNYSNNPKIEQYTIIKDKNLFDFHKEWMLYG